MLGLEDLLLVGSFLASEPRGMLLSRLRETGILCNKKRGPGAEVCRQSKRP